jgi:foldase protein PrsA
MLTWLRKNTKNIILVVAILFAFSMLYGLGYWGRGERGVKPKTNMLAKVNGKEIDPLRFRENLNKIIQNLGSEVNLQDLPFLENLALGQTIDFTLILNEAKKRVRVSGREVDGALENIMRQQNIPSKRELERALKNVGLNLSKFRDLIRDDILVQKFMAKLQQEVKVTPDDLKEIRARHILVTSEAEAQQLLARTKKGEDFAKLAKAYSKDSGSAAKGGDLGYFTLGTMVEPFEKAAFSLKPGEVSGVVKSPFGYHLIKVTEVRMRKFPRGEEPEKAALREKQERAFRHWYSEARSKAKIEIISPELRGHELRFRGKIPEAIAEYQKAIAENPTNAYLHVFLGDAYRSAGKNELALSEYENAIKLEGGNPELYLILGKAYESLGQKDMAALQYRKASLIAGDNKVLHQKLLKLFQALKRPQEVAREKEELKRIEKKEKFEKELKGEKSPQ